MRGLVENLGFSKSKENNEIELLIMTGACPWNDGTSPDLGKDMYYVFESIVIT